MTGISQYYTPRGPAAKAGDFILNIHKRQRFTDSPDEILMSLSMEIEELTFRWNKHGGCGKGSAKIALSGSESASKLITLDHELSEAGDLYGDNVSIWVKNYPNASLTITEETALQIYLGKIRKVVYEPLTNAVKLDFAGLGTIFDDIFLLQDFTNSTIEDILTHISDLATKTNEAGGNDGPLLGANYWVPDSVFRMVLPEIKAIDEQASSVLKRVIDMLPGRFVWGVDRLGRFFLYPQEVTYPDAALVNVTAVDGYSLDDLETFTRTIDLAKQHTEFTVQGALDPDTGLAVKGTAVNQRYVETFGVRERMSTESDITDPSLCAKLAQARGRIASRELVKARAEVTEVIHPDKTFRPVLLTGAPAIYINESGIPSRTMGDSLGNSLRTDGKTLGETFNIPNIAAYNVKRDWLFNISVTFESAQVPGTDYIFGMPDPNGLSSGKHGWGYLAWMTDGSIRWNWTADVAGNPNTFFVTGMSVPVAGPFPITRHFTVARNLTGTWLFFQDGVLKSQMGAVSEPVSGGSWANDFIGGKGVRAGHGGVEATFDSFYFLNIVELQKTYTSWLDAIKRFVAANAGNRLRRNWYENYGTGGGVKSWAELVELQDGRTTLPIKYPASGTHGDVALNLDATTPSAGADRNISDSVQSPEWYQGGHWGGPLVLDLETIEYKIDPVNKTVRKDMRLGSKDLGLLSALSRTELEVKNAHTLLKKRAQDV